MKIPLTRLFRNRRGGASVAIAVTMALVVAAFFIQNIMIWGQALSSEDRDRLNEKIEINSITFSLDKLVVKVQNIGSVMAHIVRLYLEPQPYGSRIDQLSISNLYLDVQESNVIEIFNPPSDCDDISDDFVVSVVTEKGNFASKTYQYEPPLPDISQVGQWGVFRVNWFYSKFSSQLHPPIPLAVLPADGSDPILSDAILINQGDKYIAFYVEVKNSYTVPVTLYNGSFLTLTSLRKSSGQVLANFYIVGGLNYATSPPVITPYQNEYVVQPGETQILMFAAEASGGDTWLWGSTTKIFGTETVTQGSGIQISLFYKLEGGNSYGQTIATQAVILEGA